MQMVGVFDVCRRKYPAKFKAIGQVHVKFYQIMGLFDVCRRKYPAKFEVTCQVYVNVLINGRVYLMQESILPSLRQLAEYLHVNF